MASKIIYHVDRFQVFRGVLVADGWAFLKGSAETVAVAVADVGPDATFVDHRDRPDVVGVHGDAPIRCGFSIRAILMPGIDITTLALSLMAGGETRIVERPWAQAVALAYQPLEALNERFFQAVKAAGTPRVLEIGARARSGTTRRQLFGDAARYIGLDIKEGENVDLIGDAHALGTYIAPCSIDFAYSVSVFEHLMWPWKVAIELGKAMKPGGLILMQSHPVWPKHEMPWDFFRFWDSGWRSLFCRETGFEVIETVEAHAVDLVSSPFTGSYVHHWENPEACLASSVLARKIGEPLVEWSAVPNFSTLGLYPG